ncbi:uncharacterized protein C8Q71DRAFT_362155 [Rhodofomes roseus]|uniref:Uncharacterized protein n=1 Tax=Rhodofomes roseus TaxID=34475 RepID=A0ABQ8K1T1_9APHY|nr:uncharacterized protein C8Q71DRAFT_362155 [Rhodofomes roseus]KAH9830649.1 hypothetical protein C8Q71DRAFT_362155 [Rhodofomes roseus]
MILVHISRILLTNASPAFLRACLSSLKCLRRQHHRHAQRHIRTVPACAAILASSTTLISLPTGTVLRSPEADSQPLRPPSETAQRKIRGPSRVHIRNMRGRLLQGHVPSLYARRCRRLEPHSGSPLPPVNPAAVVVHLEVTTPLQVPVVPLVSTRDLSFAFSPPEFDDGSVERLMDTISVIGASLLVQSSATPAVLFAQLKSARTHKH